jgi:hypothetical protein
MNLHLFTRFMWNRFTYQTAIVGMSLLLGYWSLADAAAPQGTPISNVAQLTYKDGDGNTQNQDSNTVQITVQLAPAVDVLTETTKPIGSDGGTVSFPHTIQNTSNGTDTYTLTATDPAGGITFTDVKIYIDTDGDGVWDAGETTEVATTGPLAAGGEYKVIVVATVPNTVNPSDSGTIQITATSTTNGTVTDTNTDTVSVVDATFEKKQALDASCDGTADGPFTTNPVTTGAVPGACVRYQITATNNTGVTITDAMITDPVPGFTTYHCGDNTDSDKGYAHTTAGTITTPANKTTCPQAAGTVITADVGTLTNGSSAVLTFGIRID